ncbi:sensor histidine kinase [Spirosoma rhododendri]|uniref:Histidine kinase n=1 Tax=Spirosoma rhododendri TaxID=2728024 RepID=A0A7L5DGJ7_9BACT|nr:histidine kinase [Spirosoma rhododendri]QJD77309.1 histidine kinase [Spirosoma rhododendri]
MTFRFSELYIRVLAGLILLALPVFYFAYSGVSLNPLNPHDHLIQNGLAYLFLILFSYVNHTLFVPRWFLAKRYRLYLIVAIGCVLGAVYLPYRIEQWAYFKPPRQHTVGAWFRQIFVAEMMLSDPANFSPEHRQRNSPFDDLGREHCLRDHPPGEGSPGRPPMNIPPGTLLLPVKLTIFFLLGSISTLISISVQTSSRLRQVENDQLQAELRQLKAQIHPHFLFNTLNSIYALAIRQDERTADTVVKLSEFMRYNIRDAQRDKVLLSKEIDYIGNYVDLQKARLRDAVTVDYRLDGKPRQLAIAPLLLFSFIENAFKYGVNPEEESLIQIAIDIQGNRLRMEVVNNKVQVSQLEPSTGIGLRNARDRLRLIYPNDHDLTIDETASRYQVTLRLNLV